MTNQMPVKTERAQPIDVAPPKAPMLMPTQVLQPEDGMMSRAFVPVVAMLNLFKRSFRRAG